MHSSRIDELLQMFKSTFIGDTTQPSVLSVTAAVPSSGMPFHEIDELRTLEEPGPHVVALTSWDNQLHLAAERGIALVKQTGIPFKRDNVHVPVNREHRDSMPL